MAANVDWFRRTLTNIVNEIDVINNLSEVKIALTSLNSSQLKFVASNLELGIIFDCLNSSEKRQIELGSEVLDTFLSVLEPSLVLSRYGVAMLRALSHPNKEVKVLALKEMYRGVCDSELAPRIGEEQALLLSVVRCVAHEDMSVAKISVSFLERLGVTPSNLTVLYSPPMLDALNEMKKESDTIRFRVYEIVIEISAASLPGLEESHKSGLLTELLKETKQKDDILARLTALELLTKLALTHHGLQYLETHGVIRMLADEIINSKDDPLASLILPGLIKFFGNVAQLRPKEVFSKYPHVIASVFEALQSTDGNLSGIAMETIGYVATTPDGKHCLQIHDDAMSEVMRKLSYCIDYAPTDSRVRALNTVANIVNLEVSDQDSDLLNLTENWFSRLASADVTPTDNIMNICRQPFAELKLAGFLILQSISQQIWGQYLINSCPGLVEFLMDRDIEPNLQCKTEKFKVVKALVESHTAESVFGQSLYNRLKDFVKEGPCFVYTQTEVAIEGAS